MKLSLQTPIGDLFQVGPNYERKLNKLNIHTVKDLLLHKPHRHEDFSKIIPIIKARDGDQVTVKGSIIECRNIYTRYKKVIQKAVLRDKTGDITATWFNQPFIPNNLKIGGKAYFSGSVKKTGLKTELISPEYEIAKPGQRPIHTARLVPVYPETEGLSSKWLRSRIFPLLNSFLPRLEDWLPGNVIKKHNLVSLKTAIRDLHFPNDPKSSQKALKRLSFNEMLLLQLKTHIRKNSWKEKKLAKIINFKKNKIKEFINLLPFKLTSDQIKVIQEISKDLSKKVPMNRLLLGDVGSGKTVVAAIAMYASHLSGSKSALMAPTEILTLQHLNTLKELLEPFKIKIAVCTSSKKNNLDNFDIIVGTHALLYKTVKPEHLGVVVIDEQHRFGVEQRSKLIKKATSPHTLTMTATPIPRTVALTLYGNLDLSVINQMPPGRIPIKTWLVPPKKRKAAYQWIQKRINMGEQVFIVCPLIDSSEHDSLNQVKAASDEFEHLSKKIFPKLSLDLLHGKIKSKDKERIITKFRNKKTDILVSTPVVEVGIDIPNATVMLIEGAERFGLAQLHQLRGRVGRGKQQSYCLLFTSTEKDKQSLRLKSMESAKTGPELADIDLKLRGPGQIYGIQQHGFAELKFARFSDSSLIAITRKVALEIVNNTKLLSKYTNLKKIISTLEKPIEPN